MLIHHYLQKGGGTTKRTEYGAENTPIGERYGRYFS